MSKPIQTNLDEIYLDEIKTIDSSLMNKSKKQKLIHFSDGTSIEIDANGNCIESVNVDKKSINLRPRRLKLFQLISSPPIDHFVAISSQIGKKTLKTVDYLGESMYMLLLI